MNSKQQQAPYGPYYCSFHPRELLVGVCAHCLEDRLLLLATTRDAYSYRAGGESRSSLRRDTLPKVLALGSSFLQRLDSRHHRRPDVDTGSHHLHHVLAFSDDTSVASLDDSFISIKFEDNGKATWDSNKAAATKPVQEPALWTGGDKAVVVAEHVKRGGATRWRKQVVGRLLQLARWKRSAAGQDGKKAAAERSKGRGRSWIRSLTRRRHGDRAW